MTFAAGTLPEDAEAGLAEAAAAGEAAAPENHFFFGFGVADAAGVVPAVGAPGEALAAAVAGDAAFFER